MGIPKAAVLCYFVTAMKYNNTVKYSTPIPLKLPVDTERIINENCKCKLDTCTIKIYSAYASSAYHTVSSAGSVMAAPVKAEPVP